MGRRRGEFVRPHLKHFSFCLSKGYQLTPAKEYTYPVVPCFWGLCIVRTSLGFEDPILTLFERHHQRADLCTSGPRDLGMRCARVAGGAAHLTPNAIRNRVSTSGIK